ncbi:hypothetical protein LCGC14_0252260 [marine sediment metagenome]|uniref:Uncharacterized protein n=1 Tax=marine sediment metagenome TaxID=412755 RepID=A0A0F9U956_9ZZZZ
MSLWERMVQHGLMTEGDGVVAYAMLTALTRHGYSTKTLVTQLAQLIPETSVPAMEAEVKNIIEALTANGLPTTLAAETGTLGVGVAIWRRGEGRGPMWKGTVGEFLNRSDYQSGTWLIDGGWGGPPGPIEVDWVDGQWVSQGYLGERR